ncbi:MAG: hypothetical protein ACJ79A_09020 [Gemmatimonadaceae bacterium]
MHARTLAVTALIAASLTLGACSSDNVLGLGTAGGNGGDATTSARVRIANATATSVDLVSNGVVYAGNGGLGFGMSSNCTSTNALAPGLSVRVAGTTTSVPGLATSYQSGVSYTVIAYQGALGATQFATIADVFTPVAGQSALRVFNADAAGTSYDVYVTDPGEALATTVPTFSTVAAGTYTSFGNSNAGTLRQVRITKTGSKTVLLDLGSIALVAGQSVTLVIAPPLAGATTLRGFFVTGCNV